MHPLYHAFFFMKEQKTTTLSDIIKSKNRSPAIDCGYTYSIGKSAELTQTVADCLILLLVFIELFLFDFNLGSRCLL